MGKTEFLPAMLVRRFLTEESVPQGRLHGKGEDLGFGTWDGGKVVEGKCYMGSVVDWEGSGVGGIGNRLMAFALLEEWQKRYPSLRWAELKDLLANVTCLNVRNVGLDCWW